MLDIGSGWGGLGLYLAETFDVDVLGVTLSVEQHSVATDRAHEHGLQNRVHFELRDYRDLQERFDSYQREVVTHFNTTASLVKKLTQSYQDVQEHLSESAERLALDEQTKQRLLAALHAEDGYPERRERLTPPASQEAPKDYAPKSGEGPGTLDETYGLKRKL